MAIVKSYQNEAGGVFLRAVLNCQNGPCFEHGPFFTRFRRGAQIEK